MAGPLRSCLVTTAVLIALGPSSARGADDVAVDPASGISALERPGADAGPTQVSVFMWVIGLDAVDSAAQSFTGNVFVALRWHDPRLAGQGRRLYPLDAIWTPNLIFVNAGAGVRVTLPMIAEVDPEGNVTQRQRVIGTFTQPLDLRAFPFDRQTLRLHLVSPTNPPAALALVPDQLRAAVLKDAAGVASELTVPDWSLTGWSAGAAPYEVAPGFAVAGYALDLQVRRSVAYFVLKIILPLALIIAMSWSVFFLEPGGGTRIGIATTSMLTLIAYRFAVDTQVPRVSYITRLDAFVIASTVLVFLTLVQSVLASALARADQTARISVLDRHSRWAFPALFVLIGLWSLVL